MSRYCYCCLSEVNDGVTVCPHCGQPVMYKAKDPRDLPPGTVLRNRFLIGKSIGHGGFGVTYKAIELSVHMLVCIKEYNLEGKSHRDPENPVNLLPNEGDEEEFEEHKASFHEEGSNLARLAKLPGVVHCMETFSDNNTFYLVMELLQGATLLSYITGKGGGQPHTLTAGEVTLYLREILKALSGVHRNGMLHRDISPDNIFLLENELLEDTDPQIHRIKLIDFGSARRTEEKEMTGFMKGVYTAPEVLTHDVEGFYTDLYAVGLVLYFMLMGKNARPPKSGEELSPPDTERSTAALNAIFLKATHRNPKERYQSAELMLTDLRKILEAQHKRAGSNRKKATFVIALLTVITLGLIALILTAVIPKPDSGTTPMIRATEKPPAMTPTPGSGRENVPVLTDTPSPVPIDTPTPVPTNTSTPVPTDAPTPVPTNTPTPVLTATPTPVPTATPTPVPTATPTPVPTATPTPVPTATPTPVPTATPTPVPTATPTPVPTATPTPVPTATPTPVPTATPTPVPTAIPVKLTNVIQPEYVILSGETLTMPLQYAYNTRFTPEVVADEGMRWEQEQDTLKFRCDEPGVYSAEIDGNETEFIVIGPPELTVSDQAIPMTAESVRLTPGDILPVHVSGSTEYAVLRLISPDFGTREISLDGDGNGKVSVNELGTCTLVLEVTGTDTPGVTCGQLNLLSESSLTGNFGQEPLGIEDGSVLMIPLSFTGDPTEVRVEAEGLLAYLENNELYLWAAMGTSEGKVILSDWHGQYTVAVQITTPVN